MMNRTSNLRYIADITYMCDCVFFCMIFPRHARFSDGTFAISQFHLLRLCMLTAFYGKYVRHIMRQCYLLTRYRTYGHKVTSVSITYAIPIKSYKNIDTSDLIVQTTGIKFT